MYRISLDKDAIRVSEFDKDVENINMLNPRSIKYVGYYEDAESGVDMFKAEVIERYGASLKKLEANMDRLLKKVDAFNSMDVDYKY